MSWKNDPSIDTMSITCSPISVARSRSPSQRACCRAASACSEPSSATRMLLIMALALLIRALTSAFRPAQGRPAAFANPRGSVKNRPMPRQDETLCEELKEVARRLGVQVREEVLVRGAEVIFLDRHLPPAERVEVLLDALAGRDLEGLYVSPALRRLVERRSGATG